MQNVTVDLLTTLFFQFKQTQKCSHLIHVVVVVMVEEVRLSKLL